VKLTLSNAQLSPLVLGMTTLVILRPAGAEYDTCPKVLVIGLLIVTVELSFKNTVRFLFVLTPPVNIENDDASTGGIM
jgi:hypothetical protein